ncbi:MAG: hypothetical protein IT243_00305 [Bacteroidia bacterium]|nr:hypothetical protein [Bacteroidia bacterium]
MKQLLLIRHVSAENNFFVPDYMRKLTLEGLNEIESACKIFSKFQFLPDIVNSSSSKRTIQTAKRIAEILNWDIDRILYNQSLYNSKFDSIISEIMFTSNDFNSLVIVAHNPAISDVFNFLNKSHSEMLPKCSFCLFNLKIEDWLLLKPATSELVCKI